MKLAHCIECGCHDLAACHDEKSDGPCSWLAVDREEGRGVCSACPDALARWNAGDHTIAVPVDHHRSIKAEDYSAHALTEAEFRRALIRALLLTALSSPDRPRP